MHLEKKASWLGSIRTFFPRIKASKPRPSYCIGLAQPKYVSPVVSYTVRPRDTRPQAARTLTVHVFEWGPTKFAVNDRKYVFHFRPKPKPKPEKPLALGRIPKPKVQIYVKIGGILLKFNVSNDLSN